MPLKKKIVYSVTLILFLIFTFSLIYIINPIVIQRLLNAYGNIVNFIEGEKVREASAGSRVKQLIICDFFLRKTLRPSFLEMADGVRIGMEIRK